MTAIKWVIAPLAVAAAVAIFAVGMPLALLDDFFHGWRPHG